MTEDAKPRAAAKKPSKVPKPSKAPKKPSKASERKRELHASVAAPAINRAFDVLSTGTSPEQRSLTGDRSDRIDNAVSDRLAARKLWAALPPSGRALVAILREPVLTRSSPETRLSVVASALVLHAPASSAEVALAARVCHIVASQNALLADLRRDTVPETIERLQAVLDETYARLYDTPELRVFAES